MKEAEFQAAVIQAARFLGWLVYHTHDSRRSEPGFPDLVLVRRADARVVFAELKTTSGVSSEQRKWLDALGAAAHHGEGIEVYVWRPDDWPKIEKVLAR